MPAILMTRMCAFSGRVTGCVFFMRLYYSLTLFGRFRILEMVRYFSCIVLCYNGSLLLCPLRCSKDCTRCHCEAQLHRGSQDRREKGWWDHKYPKLACRTLLPCAEGRYRR